MHLLFGLVGTFILCGVILFYMGKKDEKDKIRHESQKVLYHSSNKDSYVKANDVFKILSDSNININYLGSQR